MNAFLH